MRKQRGKTISQNCESVEIFCFVTVHTKCEVFNNFIKKGVFNKFGENTYFKYRNFRHYKIKTLRFLTILSKTKLKKTDSLKIKILRFLTILSKTQMEATIKVNLMKILIFSHSTKLLSEKLEQHKELNMPFQLIAPKRFYGRLNLKVRKKHF